MKKRWPFQRGSRFETSTAGFDPALALVQGNPYGTPTGPGLIIPQAAGTSYLTRYLFLLATYTFNPGEIARIRGMRQLLTIAAFPATGSGNAGYLYPLELPVTTPTWHFSDANVSWHLRRMDPQPNVSSNAYNGPNLAYRMSSSPALLFERAQAESGGYLPPYGGRPPGNICVPDLGAFQDIRFPWKSDRAWDRLDVEIEGPGTFALFASVQQTNPNSRAVLTLPGSLPGGTTSAFPPEELFIQNFPQSWYYRIGRSLIFREALLLPGNGCERRSVVQPEQSARYHRKW